MTVNKKFKAVVRERMAQTGESYMQARAALLKERDCVHSFVAQGACNEDLICVHCGAIK